jgi:TetR/AcrR family transcriptional repressor of mexJK operon
MDEVASAAAVSKQTVYKQYASKEALFREVVTSVVRARDAGITTELSSADDGSFDEQLRSFARFFVRGVMQPDVLKLRRLVIGEANRFPELGAAFYELGPKRAAEQLAVALRELADKHSLTLPDPELAAQHLLSLILSTPLEQATLVSAEQLTDADLDRYADEGVRVFLRAYT